MLIDRSGGKVDFGIKTEKLLTVDIKTYLPEECPLCKRGILVAKPGSRELWKGYNLKRLQFKKIFIKKIIKKFDNHKCLRYHNDQIFES